MQFWQTVLNIFIFIICLSLVVCIHEAGHLAVAKICKVYCFEYSIGFGPAIFRHRFRHKKKKSRTEKKLTANLYVSDQAKKEAEYVEGETELVIRALPLGGFVSMAGEDGNIGEDGTIIPKERCLNGVNHFKQLCIILAGVTMNFILAILLFIGSNLAPQEANVLDTNKIVTIENGAAYKAGLRSGDKILSLYQKYEGLIIPNTNTNQTYEVEFPAVEDRQELKYYQQTTDGQTPLTYDDFDHASISYASQDIFTNYLYNKTATKKPLFDLDAYSKKYHIENLTKYVLTGGSTRTFYITYERVVNGETKKFDIVTDKVKTIEEKESSTVSHFKYDLLGISCSTKTVYYGFGDAVTRGFNQFGNLFVNLYGALGSVFTPDGWKNVGGIISVYKMSAEGTTSGSFSYILLLWGYISLNLGCFNLLPLPGLDGWQALMVLFETITRKKVPAKFKNVANTIGLLVLFALAGLLVIKDIVMF